MARVLTILARGFLFHHPDGSLTDDPRSRIEYARRALCVWCSVPDPRGTAPKEVVYTLIAYYAANKPEDSDWVVLPVASFNAYFGTTSFGRKYLRLIPGEILERPDSGFGVCRYRVREEYRI